MRTSLLLAAFLVMAGCTEEPAGKKGKESCEPLGADEVDLSGSWSFDGSCPYWGIVIMDLELSSDSCGTTGTGYQELGDPGSLYRQITHWDVELADRGSSAYDLKVTCTDFYRLDDDGEEIDPGCYHTEDGSLPLTWDGADGLIAAEVDWGCDFTMTR